MDARYGAADDFVPSPVLFYCVRLVARDFRSELHPTQAFRARCPALAMHSPILSFPIGFSWLSPACRPPPEEIETYAALIALREGEPPENAEKFRREAELQLWVWHNETRQRPKRRRRARVLPLTARS